jgi:hypothetical protein
LFNEKAEELHQTKERLTAAHKETEGTRAQVRDLQDREEELQNLLGKTRASLEDEYRDKAQHLRREVEVSSERVAELELSLEETSTRYAQLQESYKSSVQSLGIRLGEITAVLRDHQEQEDERRRQTMDDTGSQPSVELSDDSAVVCDRRAKEREDEKEAEDNEMAASIKVDRSSRKKKAKRKRKAAKVT